MLKPKTIAGAARVHLYMKRHPEHNLNHVCKAEGISPASYYRWRRSPLNKTEKLTVTKAHRNSLSPEATQIMNAALPIARRVELHNNHDNLVMVITLPKTK